MSSRKRVLEMEGTGYLGQHILQGFSEIQGTPFEYDLAFTYHSNLPQPLLDVLPPLLAFHVDLKTEQGFEPISHSFGQWIDGVLSKGEKMDFFHDEFGCPVYVKDVVAIIRALTSRWISEVNQMQMLLNVGGPDRVSRVQMAEAVVDFRGCNTPLITAVSASSVDQGIKSPADISMNRTKLVQTLNFSPTSFTDGVKLTLTTGAKS